MLTLETEEVRSALPSQTDDSQKIPTESIPQTSGHIPYSTDSTSKIRAFMPGCYVNSFRGTADELRQLCKARRTMILAGVI
jgi:hypothetical protein